MMDPDKQDIAKKRSNSLPHKPIDEAIKDLDTELHDGKDLHDSTYALKTQNITEADDMAIRESATNCSTDPDTDVSPTDQVHDQDKQEHKYQSLRVEDDPEGDSSKAKKSFETDSTSLEATAPDSNEKDIHDSANNVVPDIAPPVPQVDTPKTDKEVPQELPFSEGPEISSEQEQDIRNQFGDFGPVHDIDYGSSSDEDSDQPPTEEASALMSFVENLTQRNALDRDETPQGLAEGIELHEHQKIALHWLKDREANPIFRGGILADDMGLGKTIEMIALMVSRPFKQSSSGPQIFRRFDEMDTSTSASVTASNEVQCNGTTLIVAPASLLRQWDKEIRDKTEPMLRPWIFERKPGTSSLSFKSLPIVLISYESLGMDYDRAQKGKKTLFFDRKSLFYRVILDEAHKIKNRNSRMSEACRSLKAEYKWYVSGTPIQNGIVELYPAMDFLKVSQFDQWDYFDQHVLKVDVVEAVINLHPVLRGYLLRRTKTSTIDDKPILTLPEKVQNYKYTDFDQAQRDAYDSLERETQRQYKKYKQETNHDHTFKPALLLRLRQACLHPWLINFTLGDALHRYFLCEQRLVRNAAYNFSIEQINRISSLLKAAVDTGDDFKCEHCKKWDVTRLIPACGHALCHHCSGDVDLGATNLSDFEPRKDCPECHTRFEKLSITTVVAFKCAWWPGFRRDSWDEDYLEEYPIFDANECFKPLISELHSNQGGRTSERRRIDSRIWGVNNIDSIREYFDDNDLSVIIDDKDTSSRSDDDKEYPKAGSKRKSNDQSNSSSVEPDISYNGSAPRKRHHGAAETETTGRSLEVYNTQNHQDEEEPLFVEDDIPGIEHHTDNATTPPTTHNSISDSEHDTISTGQSSPFSIKQECLSQIDRQRNNIDQATSPDTSMEDIVESSTDQHDLAVQGNHENMGAAQDESAWLDSGTTSPTPNPDPPEIRIPMPSVVPEFQLRVKKGEFDLPLNHPRLKRQACRGEDDKRRYLARLLEDQLPECTKITTLIALLNQKHVEFPEDRIIIFCEFTTMLDFVEAMFSQLGRTNYLRYDGTLTAEQKHNVVRKFMDTSNDVRILLCSLRSGNVGLNLTSANHVIFMEPFWNPFVEDQAVDRCHRIGQTKTVYITRIVVPSTIEGKILDIQEDKRVVVGHVIDNKEAFAAGGQLTKKDYDFLLGTGKSAKDSERAQENVDPPPDPTV